MAGPGRGALLVRGWGKVLTATWMDGECHLTALRADLSFSLQEAGTYLPPKSPFDSRGPLPEQPAGQPSPLSLSPTPPSTPVTLWTQLSPGLLPRASGQLSPRPRRPHWPPLWLPRAPPSVAPTPGLARGPPAASPAAPPLRLAASSSRSPQSIPCWTACPLGRACRQVTLARVASVELSMVGPLGTLQEVGPVSQG